MDADEFEIAKKVDYEVYEAPSAPPPMPKGRQQIARKPDPEPEPEPMEREVPDQQEPQEGPDDLPFDPDPPMDEDQQDPGAEPPNPETATPEELQAGFHAYVLTLARSEFSHLEEKEGQREALKQALSWKDGDKSIRVPAKSLKDACENHTDLVRRRAAMLLNEDVRFAL